MRKRESADSCTTILVGKNASYDGSTIVARTEDSQNGVFTPKKLIVVKPEDQPRHYKSILSSFEIDLPDNPVRYTAVPDAIPKDGIWGEAGINVYNVAMSETETITTNSRVLGADPLVESGIGEEDMLTLVLPYVKTAREGVLRLGKILEEYGTYESNGIAISDVNEIWWLETIGGHHWMARRVPDDAYVTNPNQLGSDYFEFGNPDEFLCDPDLEHFVTEYHLILDQEGKGFNPRYAFGSQKDKDRHYNTPRAWAIQRFLNPDRVNLPDIDTDFDDDGRGRVLQWVMDKYGHENCAHIITYSTMATKNSIKDVARVEKLPLDVSNALCKAIPERLPDGMKMNLTNAIKCTPELQDAEVSEDIRERNTIKYAKMLEGTVRGTGIHACGFIICRNPIDEWVPISTATDPDFPEKKVPVTQYDGHVIESTGLIKMDFLGLKTLSELKEACKVVKQTTGDVIDLEKIPIDDELTYQLYQRGQTVGTFQFESAGMQKYLRELHPTVFEDLIAMNALYRPGPMDYIPDFIKRKHDPSLVKYDIPCMEKYLKDTYGITVYQEQVMLLSRQLANFTRGESDALRKAMGKKMKAIVDKMKPKFIKQGQENGHDPQILEKIWSDWEKFASYAFNKSHATCYSWVAYQTAYMKAHYPAEYMAALMTRRFSQITEITKLMEECKALKIATLGPDVNESQIGFGVNKHGEIRFGLSAIKGMGASAAESIVREREKNGPYKDIYDFAERVDFSNVNRKAFESLAYSGGFDSFGLQREQYFAITGKGDSFLDTIVRYGQLFQAEKAQQQNSLFAGMDAIDVVHPVAPKAEKWPVIEKLNKERELVGIYLSAHPLDEYSVVLNNMCNTHCSKIGRNADMTQLAKADEVTFGGIVTSVNERFSQKTGKPFGFVTIEDFGGTGELALFGDDWARWNNLLKMNYTVYITAKCQPRYRNNPELLELKVQKIEQLYDVKENRLERLTISMDATALDEAFVKELSTVIEQHTGNTQLYIQLRTPDSTVLMLKSKKGGVNVDRKLIDFISSNEKMEFHIN